MLKRKFANYRLHMTGVIQNEQKCLTFIWSFKIGKTLIRLDQKEENSTSINK